MSRGDTEIDLRSGLVGRGRGSCLFHSLAPRIGPSHTPSARTDLISAIHRLVCPAAWLQRVGAYTIYEARKQRDTQAGSSGRRRDPYPPLLAGPTWEPRGVHISGPAHSERRVGLSSFSPILTVSLCLLVGLRFFFFLFRFSVSVCPSFFYFILLLFFLI
jgi:hypothetical protein